MKIFPALPFNVALLTIPLFLQGETEDAMPLKSYLNARMERPDGSLGLSASALFWTPTISNAFYAQTTPNAQLTYATTGPYSTPNFKLDWGFRVGIDGKLPHDSWGFNLTYSWINFFASSVTQGQSGQTLTDALSGNTILNNPQQIYNTWRFLYNNFNLFLGRAYKFSEWVDFYPYFGLKVLWYHIVQNNSDTGIAIQNQFGTSPYFVNQNQRQTAVGPMAGFQPYIDLGWGFSLSGDFALGLGYSSYRYDQQEYTVNNGTTTTYLNTILHQNLTLFEGTSMFTLGWENSFNEWLDCGLSLGWEFHLLAGASQSLGNVGGNQVIALNGGTLTAWIEF